MSELQSYYDAFKTGAWAHADASKCPCGGSGWALSDVDTWHECPVHYHGQAHPEDLGFEDEAPVEAAALAELELHGAPVAPECDDLPF